MSEELDLSTGELETHQTQEETKETEGLESKGEKKEEEDFKFDFGDVKETKDDENEGVKDIVKKFPKIFDEFPKLRSNYFRAQQFLSVFPNVDAAKQALASSTTLSELEKEIFDEIDVKKVLGRIQRGDEKVFKAFVLKFLDAVREISNDLYVESVIPVLNETILNLNRAGHQRGDDNVKNAAIILNMYVNGSKVLPDGSKVEIKVDKKDDKVDEDTRRALALQFNTARDYVSSKVEGIFDKNLDKLITADKFKNKYLREKLKEDIKKETLRAIGDDDIHVRNMNSLWVKAQRTGFARETLDEISGSVIHKIAHVLPKVKTRLEKEIEVSSSEKEEKNDDENPDVAGKPSSNGREVDWDRTSDLDYLNGNIKYKKKG